MHKALQLVCILVLLVTTAWARVDVTPEQIDEWKASDRLFIRSIGFSGIKTFTRTELMLRMATERPPWYRRYVPIGPRPVIDSEEFAKDLFRVEHFYQREGFPDVVVRGTVEPDGKRQKVRLRIEVEEGQPILVERWSMEGDSGVNFDSSRWASRLTIREGRRLAYTALEASSDTLAYMLRDASYARANVDYLTEVDSARYRAAVTFRMHPGQYCFIGQTRINGLKNVSEQTVRRELEYKERTPFRPGKLEHTRENIVRMELFTLVSVREDTSVPGTVLPVYIDTRETRRYSLRAKAGYDSEEYTRVQTEFRDLNFFGRGRRLTWINTLAELRQGTEVRLFWPHTPWNVTDVTLAPKWEYRIEQGFRVDNRTNTTILSAEPLHRVNVSVANEVGTEITRTILGDRPDTTQRVFKSVESFSVGWDTRDNRLIPRRGHFAGFTLSESGAFYRTDQRWWRARFLVSAVQPLTKLLSIATKSEYGVMGPLYESPETPLSERFRYGGSSTVRGWAQDRLSPRAPDNPNISVGGNTAFHLTSELRRMIWGPVTLAVFVDAGNVWRNFEDVQMLNLLPSVGAGILVFSPVGPIRLDYAWQLRPNPFAGNEGSRQLHFSIGTPF